MTQHRIGIDVGGTFTDVVLIDEQLGTLTVSEVLNRERAGSDVVVEAIGQVIELAELCKLEHLLPERSLPLADAGWRVFAEAMGRGAYLRPLGNVVYVTPSLNIPDADLAQLLEILQESVSKVLGER